MPLEIRRNGDGVEYIWRGTVAFWNVSFPLHEAISEAYRGRRVGIVYDGKFWDADTLKEITGEDAKAARKYLEETGFMHPARIPQAMA